MEHSCRRLIGEITNLRRKKRKYHFKAGSEKGVYLTMLTSFPIIDEYFTPNSFG